MTESEEIQKMLDEISYIEKSGERGAWSLTEKAYSALLGMNG